MNNLAATYSALGRHADAVALFEQVLEIRRRVLPADHPDIGEGCEGRDALQMHVMTARVLTWFDLTSTFFLIESTCRLGHEQPCSNIL